MEVIPGPIVFKAFGLFGQVIDDEFLAFFKERAGALLQIRSAVLFCDSLVVQGF
jgi:hypothetical protein